MKKITLISLLLLSFTISCTKSPEQKVKRAIDNYMKLNLGEYKSYEPVQFGKIDTAYNELNTEWEEKSLAEWKELRVSTEGLEMAWMGEEYNGNNRKQLSIIDSIIRRYEFIIDSATKNYVRYKVGFMVNHSYRVNKSGTTVLCSGDFYLNNTLDTVYYARQYDCK